VENPDLRGTAFHEAGHIAVALHCQTVPLRATIESTDERNGAVFTRWPSRHDIDTLEGWKDLKHSGADLRAEALSLLGGAAVDQRRRRELVGWQNDVAQARFALRVHHGDAQRAAADLPRVFEEARAIVERPEVWRSIEFIAETLLRRRRIERMKMLRMVLKAARMMHGASLADEEIRSWRDYWALAEEAGGGPLAPIRPSDFLPPFWIPAAFAAVLLMHALIE
jgi:hypothetical protein